MSAGVLQDHVWLVVLLWGVLYMTHYPLALHAAYLNRSGLGQHIVYEGGYVLTPQHAASSEASKIFIPRFAWLFVGSAALDAIGWGVGQHLWMPQFFDFAAGALILRQAVFHVRLAHTIALGRMCLGDRGLGGELHYARWLMLGSSASEFFSFAVLFLLLAVMAAQFFFLGGTFACLIVGAQDRRLSIKELRTSARSAAEPS